MSVFCMRILSKRGILVTVRRVFYWQKRMEEVVRAEEGLSIL